MKNNHRSILSLSRLLPALLVLAACGSAKAPGATNGGAAGSGVAGTSGAAGASGAAGTSGAGGADATGANGGAAGASGTAGGAAAGGAGSTGAAGVLADGSAPDGGAGTAPPSDGPLNPDAGTVLPRYDGGFVSVINTTNWNETTIHPFNKRRMLVRDQGDPHLALLDFGSNTPLVWKTVAGGPYARGMQLIGNNQVLAGRHDGYEVFDLTTGQIVKSVTDFAITLSAYRMANGETMLAQSGTVLSFLDKTDRISHAISYPGFGYTRLARPTRNNTFLVPQDTRLFEGDANGKVLWTVYGSEWGEIWESLLMSDGNVLVATGMGASLDVVDRDTHLVTKRVGTKAMPMAATFKPNAFCEFQILPNGNFITSNWQGYGATNGASGIQVIEFLPTGEVAWFFQQDASVFSSIQGVMVIDGMDPKFLHVQEISADSTWQPVIPTP